MSVIVEIGSLREAVEIIEKPLGKPSPRIGRIRHANGENVSIDHETLEQLMERARLAREPERSSDVFSGTLYA